jgi:hypothetical protein
MNPFRTGGQAGPVSEREREARSEKEVRVGDEAHANNMIHGRKVNKLEMRRALPVRGEKEIHLLRPRPAT